MAEQQSNHLNSVFDAIKSLKIGRITDIPVDVPHLWGYRYPNPEPDGSFVVVVKNVDTNEGYRCYMPVYVVNRGREGKLFVYEGSKKRKHGNIFHTVSF